MSEKVIQTKRINKPALAGLWYTVSAFLERGSAIIFTPVYTRLLLPSEYGIYSLYVGLMGIVTVFATLEISGGAVYRGLKEFGKESSFIPSALGLISLSSVIFLLLYHPVRSPASEAGNHPAGMPCRRQSRKAGTCSTGICR